MIDHSLLHPTMTDTDLKRECEIARKYDVASVCIKPYAVKMAVELLKNSNVLVGTVIGFPHGNSATSIKTLETEQACKDGAVEIDMVVNIGKVLSEDWEYVEKEIQAIQTVVESHDAILKVIFENDFLPEDKFIIRLCEICSKVGVGFVKTSTGYGFSKATEHAVKLMRKHSDSSVEVKAAGGIRTWEDSVRYRSYGVTRIGASATEKILTKGKSLSGTEGY
ncbi:UNVERIFIED_CONTAM: hypothetical protein GTU68_042973 [Idotea baltica]|nr:hypothetical protein [Idotea baltica]